MQIAIALVTLALCGGFLWWFRKSENRRSFKRSEEESAERERKAQETAQEFVNARDLGENCLYTNDGYIFAYLKVDGVCLELLSRQEQKALCRQVSAAFSLVRRPYKFSGVSRPADISKSLQKYSELAEQAVGGRKKLLLSDHVPTAVIGINDAAAVGAMNCIQEHGLRIPEDISVVGYDNTPVCNMMTPKLTSVDYNYEEFAEKLIATVDGIYNSTQLPPLQLIEPTLVVRSSTGPARSGM